MTACSSHHDAFLRPGKWVNDVTNRGERYLPLVNAYNAAMHLGHMASYQEALRYSYGRKVLDIGCGVGYGAFFLAAYGAGQVVGVDVSGNALAYARRVYHHPVLRYLQASALQLPFADQTFDFVFSSQVIEHVPSVAAFLAEVKRVLSPTGFCLITTPNKTLFTPLKTGNNPHHLNEMDLRTYAEYMRQAFPRIRLCGIPQNGLWLPPGQSIPVVKPNAEIRPQDFQIQHDNLEQCENLLCLGHKQAGGEFSAGLPAAYRPAANETAPLFWDSTAAAWAVMGLHPDNTPPWPEATAGVPLQFESPLPTLYRVEVTLERPAKHRLVVSLRRPAKIGQRLVAKTTLSPGKKQVTLVFSPRPNSRRQRYSLTIQPVFDTRPAWQRWASSIKRLFRKPSPTPAAGSPPMGGIRFTLRTFHNYLPAPTGVAPQPHDNSGG